MKGGGDVFEVEPSSKVSIMAHSSVYATVAFRPMAIQSYSACFEVIPDSAKGKSLTFELYGEGNLPQVSVTRPVLRNSKGQCCMLFQRLSLHHHQTQILVLANTGTISAMVTLEVTQAASVFDLQPPTSEPGALLKQDSADELLLSPLPTPNPRGPLTLTLGVGESTHLPVKFTPLGVKKYKGELWVSIKDNMFERFPVRMVGEGYEDDLIIDSIRGQTDEERVQEPEEVPDDVEGTKTSSLFSFLALFYAYITYLAATRAIELNFGTLAVSENRQISFRLGNLSESTVKFQWPSVPLLVFQPSVGHIKPKTSKTVYVTFKATKPQALKAQRVVGKVCKILFNRPLARVPDWDDRMKSVQWVTAPPPPPSTTGGLENASLNSIPGSSSTASKPHIPPLKRKVVETEKEPSHQVVEESQRELELAVTGTADFCKYECPVQDIRFRDTLMFQTRAYSFPLRNVGKIRMSYEWALLSQPQSRPNSHTVDERESFLSEQQGKESATQPLPFSVSPLSGTIAPEKEATITIRFTPVTVTETGCFLHCQ